MLDALGAMWMDTKINFEEMKYPILKRQDRVVAEEIYKNKVNKLEETEKYEKSKLPESGYMTVEEYEAKSRAKSKKEMAEGIEGGKIPKDSNMVYVPQKTFKLVKYNEPVGSPELVLPRKLNFDRQINAQGIISGDKTMLVYPSVYYYAQSDCTTCDLFLIKLDTSLSDTEKVMRANIVQKETEPLISTEKDINTQYIFRTLTPIDFSVDNKHLIVKEKIGHRFDGIWKTDIWIYDFEKKEGQKIPQVREAIINYWAEAGGVDFDENRWDIYPMGFDANNDDRVILCAYAYTGEVPKFLGTWSIDLNGNNAKLEDLSGADVAVSIIGYKLAEDSLKEPYEVEHEAKQAEKKEKLEKKQNKKSEKFEKELKELEYNRKIHQMDRETYLKIQQRREQIKELKKNFKQSGGLTGN